MSLPSPTMHPWLITLGHWKLRHTPMLFCVGQIVTLVSFGLFTLIRNSPGLFKSFGFGHLGQPAFVSLVLFQFLSAPLDEVIDRLSGDIKAAAAERLVCWPAIGSPVHFVAPASNAAALLPAALSAPPPQPQQGFLWCMSPATNQQQDIRWCRSAVGMLVYYAKLRRTIPHTSSRWFASPRT